MDHTTISEALIARLQMIGHPSESDCEAIRELRGEVRQLQRGEDVFANGSHPKHIVVVLSGILCRYNVNHTGDRQIYSLYFANDAPSLETLHMPVMDNSLGALTTSVVGVVPHHAVYELMARHPGLNALMWRETLVQGALVRESLMRNSIQHAPARMAHFFCETLVRSKVAGLASGNTTPLPITQDDLSDILALSAVHTNRTLMAVRATGYVEFSNRLLSVYDWNGLADMAKFDLNYLHLVNEKASQLSVQPTSSLDHHVVPLSPYR